MKLERAVIDLSEWGAYKRHEESDREYSEWVEDLIRKLKKKEQTAITSAYVETKTSEEYFQRMESFGYREEESSKLLVEATEHYSTVSDDAAYKLLMKFKKKLRDNIK